MEYAAPRQTVPTRRSLLAPVVALLVGAGLAVGGYALIDDQDTVPGGVVVVETPGPGQGVRGIDDMAHVPTTSVQPQTVVPYMSHGQGIPSQSTKDEAATAAAIGASSGVTQSTKDESATAAAIGAGSDSQSDETSNRTDPHGPGAALHSR
jgi:hypothetical protein